MKHLNLKAFGGLVALLIVVAIALFVPAWTLDYWQAWVFLAVFFGSSFVITVYLMKKDPKLLERRVTAGPLNEKEKSQKVIQFIAQFAFLLVLVFPVFDHRFGWSVVPMYANIAGDLLIAIGFYIVYQNQTEATAAARERAAQREKDAEQQSREPDPAFARRLVTYASRESPGTIVVDPGSHYLYLLLPGGQAVRYGVGVGGEGFGWSGVATVHTKQEWPDWYPPSEMLERKPDLKEHMVQLQSGLGMHGGPENPNTK